MKKKIKIEEVPNCVKIYFKGEYNGHTFIISDTEEGIFVSFNGDWGHSMFEHKSAIDEIVRKYRKKKEKLFKF